MPDWTKSMIQTFEYYTVDPGTWRDKERITNVIKSTISRDADSETLGSASFDVLGTIGECYIREYLITNQNGVIERFPLGTHLVQTPSESFDGKKKKISLDAYTPLLELKENPPPLGYSILKDSNVMDNAYYIMRDNMRGPVVKTSNDKKLYSDFVANTDDKWLSFITDLIANAKYHLDIDEMGRTLFAPDQELESLQPKWTYSDDDKSILYSDISMDRDLYGIPNVVEVIYSGNDGTHYVEVVNDDENSPTSTIARGRKIIYRDTDPDLSGVPTDDQLQEYAESLLKKLSSVEYTVTYSHGYCPVRVGDCVRLNYSRADLIDVKAKVVSQSIECSAGCKVNETAVFTKKLWR